MSSAESTRRDQVVRAATTRRRSRSHHSIAIWRSRITARSAWNCSRMGERLPSRFSGTGA